MMKMVMFMVMIMVMVVDDVADVGDDIDDTAFARASEKWKRFGADAADVKGTVNPPSQADVAGSLCSRFAL